MKSDGLKQALKVAGEWPNQLQLSQSWAKAVARPWNDDFPAVALRLERGSARFLRACTDFVRELASPVLSPALLPARARLWADAGYAMSDRLVLLEHNLAQIPGVGRDGSPSKADLVAGQLEPAEELYEIDQAAFPVRWRMGLRGLQESVEATSRTAVHRLSDQGGTTAFAVTGVSLGQGYLQRLAVHPRAQGKGQGTTLVQASLLWARTRGARVLLVNTQPDNQKALRLYEQTGFTMVAGGLVVMAAVEG